MTTPYRPRYYRLVGTIAMPCTMMEVDWNNRRVAETFVGKIRISTVFLALDHAFGDGPPRLFETMQFGGGRDQDCDRYETWTEAMDGHAAWVDRAQREQATARAERLAKELKEAR